MAEEDENILASGKSVAEELIFTLSRLIKSKGGSSFEDLLYLVSPDGLAFLDDLASQIVEYRSARRRDGVAACCAAAGYRNARVPILIFRLLGFAKPRFGGAFLFMLLRPQGQISFLPPLVSVCAPLPIA